MVGVGSAAFGWIAGVRLAAFGGMSVVGSAAFNGNFMTMLLLQHINHIVSCIIRPVIGH